MTTEIYTHVDRARLRETIEDKFDDLNLLALD